MTYQLPKFSSILNHDAQVRAHLKTLNQNQARDLLGEIFGHLYWFKKKAVWAKTDSRKYIAGIRRLHRLTSKRLKTGQLQPERSRNGLILERSLTHVSCGEYGVRLQRNGWDEFWQGAYQGLWGNERNLTICNYCEGSVTTMTASSLEQWQSEIDEQIDWLNDNA
jgi:hypothetical protein